MITATPLWDSTAMCGRATIVKTTPWQPVESSTSPLQSITRVMRLMSSRKLLCDIELEVRSFQLYSILLKMGTSSSHSHAPMLIKAAYQKEKNKDASPSIRALRGGNEDAEKMSERLLGFNMNAVFEHNHRNRVNE